MATHPVDIKQNVYDESALANKALLIGKSGTSSFLPVKVVDDGSGYGKLVCVVE